MHKYMFLALALAVPAWGQDQSPDLRTAAGCGPEKTQFSVKTDKLQHALTQPESGKALVYVIVEQRPAIGPLWARNATTRVGLDGKWIGANHGESYLSFAMEPGEHHVCTDWQSSLESLQKLSAAAELTAEAGKTYYYQVEVTIPADDDGRYHDNKDRDGQVRLKTVDEAEGQLLISKTAFSTWKMKK